MIRIDSDDYQGDYPKYILRMCGDVRNGAAGADGDGGFDGRFCS